VERVHKGFDSLDVRGKLLDTRGVVRVFEGFPQNFLDVQFPSFSQREQELFDFLVRAFKGTGYAGAAASKEMNISSDFFSLLNKKVFGDNSPLNISGKFLSPPEYLEMKKNFAVILKKHLKDIKDPDFFSSRLIDEALGFSSLSVLLTDSGIEEIMVNGAENVFVYDKHFGMCKTNIFLDKKKIRELVQKLFETSGKKLSFEVPFLDARLPDGSRANATLSAATPFGDTITIRKFSHSPLSIIDLISHGTLSFEAAAFLWVLVEGFGIEPINGIITGGAGSGKTTTLNVLLEFVPYSDRIISIEDTLELDLGSRSNWVQMEAKLKTRQENGVSMDDLLKNSLRMRPDRLIVGEVRGEEAQTLFVAMDTGHKGCMGTLHSNTSKELITRITSHPMSVPYAMLPLLELIIVQYRVYVRGRGVIRRIKEITEVSSMDGKPLLANIFEWNREKDLLERTNVPSRLLEVLSERTMFSKKEVLSEISVRKRILEWLGENKGISKFNVDRIIQEYYFDPEQVLEKVVNQKSP
jgi:archaeal flagellar protein FlaI